MSGLPGPFQMEMPPLPKPKESARAETWVRPDGYTGPCPECGSTTCKGYYKPDSDHLLAF